MNCNQLNEKRNNWGAALTLFGMIATYTIVIGTWSVNRYLSFNSTLWDMGIMLQAIWNTAHGRILYESVNLGFSASRLAVAHWEIIYLPLALIYRIIPSTSLLLYLQALILACGTIPIYRFASKKLASPAAAVFIALAYLFYPALHGANLFDLHGLTLATPFLLFTFYYLDQSKRSLTLLFAGLSLACREDVALVIFSLGLYAWIRRKNGRIAIPLLLLSAGWLTVFFLRFQFIGAPELAETTSMVPNWEHLTLRHLVRSISQTFSTMVQLLFSQENVKYLVKLVLPVIGLCFLSFDVLLIAAPTLLLNLLSRWPQMHQIEYHYTATITPFIFLAAINGMVNLNQRLNRSFSHRRLRVTLAFTIAIALASIMSTTQFSILRFHRTWQVSEMHRKLSQRLQAIPAHLSVSTTARAGSHLANRRELYHFPERSSETDIVVLELNRPDIEIKNLVGTARVLRLPAMNHWTRVALEDTTRQLLWVEDNVYCLQRLTSRSVFADQFFVLDTLPHTLIAVDNCVLDEGLEFIGWQPVYIGKQQAHFILYWRKSKPLAPTAKLIYYLKLPETLQSIPDQPFVNRMPLALWPTGKIIADRLFIDRPENAEVKICSIIASLSLSNPSQQHHLFDFNFQ